jgi:peptidoglycan/xylan/chitin deacetylase (PgdA/CDA1 family)
MTDEDHAAALDVCLTVDLEPDCPPYLWTWRGMTEGAPKLLDLLACEAVPATFFTTGRAAEHGPATVSEIMTLGHELACHGMTHRDFTTLTHAEAVREIADSAALLRAVAPVTAFRAPYLRFPDRLLDVLAEHGFRVDCSQARYKTGHRRPARPAGVLRIPASVTSSVLRLPRWIRDPWLLSLRSPVVLFVHPWEFVDLTRERIRLDCRFRTGEPALADLAAVIRLFKSRGARFRRIDDLAGTMRRASA